MQKLWTDIQKGRMFVCGANAVRCDNAEIESTPSTLAMKRNPGRTWIAEKRAIVWKGMMNAIGLMPQLQRQSVRELDKKSEKPNGRAGGEGGKGGHRGISKEGRLVRISKNLPQLCRRDRNVFRQKDGFVSLSDILNSFRRPESPPS